MGIKDLTEIIAQYSPGSIKTISLKVFSSHKIAIDIDVLIHKFYSIVYNSLSGNINSLVEDIEETKLIDIINNHIYQHINRYFFANDIKVIVVFGGPAPPEKDQYARKIRDGVKERAQTKLKCAIKDYGGLSISDYMALDLKIIEEHKNIKKAATRIPSSLWKSLRAFLEDKQVSCVTAVNEAEELCAALCLEDIVQGVYSTDTDNIVRRCDILITKVFVEQGITKANIITYNDNLLRDLKMTYSQFFDMCILLGCDYNKRISGNGTKSCYEKIQCYKSINAIQLAEPEKDWDNVNYIRCKQIFNFNHLRSAAQCSVEDLNLVM